MRSYLRRAVPLAAAAVVSTGLIAGPAIAEPGPSTASQVVEYRGYQLTVPADWDVVNLDQHPDTCVRLDRPAVYLGHPNPDASCPAGLTGRADTVLIQPADQTAADTVGTADVQTLNPDGSLPTTFAATPAHEIVAAVEPAGLLLRGSYAQSPDQIEQILRTGTFTDDAQPGTLPAPSAASSAAESAQTYGTSDLPTYTVTPGAFWGYAFDTCTAPSFGQMDAWMSASPYRGVGIYIGGGLRACGQANLTPEWVARQAGQGWRMLPLYVGLQAPCSAYWARIQGDVAYAQGVDAASDATIQASYLGIQPGSVVYFDMEGYNNTDAACSNAVLTFLSGWTARLHELGYRSGVYSSASSGVADVARAVGNPAYHVPDHIWFARWDGYDTSADAAIPDTYWVSARIKQYAGGHDESYAGVLMNIDSNFADVR